MILSILNIFADGFNLKLFSTFLEFNKDVFS